MDSRYRYIYLILAFMIALLFIQFILGIFINLYVTFPPLNSISQVGPKVFPSNYITVMFHMMLGFLILIVSLIMILISFRIGSAKLLLSSIISSIFVIIAGISGILFLFNEFNRYSFLMGLSFIIVVMSEFYYLYSLKTIEMKVMKN
jgi:hypothetical protein